MINRRIIAWAWALLVCLLAGHNAWLWLGKHAAPDTDILALLPLQERDPVLQRSFTQMVDAAQQRVVVLIGAPDWQQARAAATAYRQQLAAGGKLFEPAKLDAASQANWLTLFQQHRLNLLTTAQEKTLRSQPVGVWVDNALASLYAAFSGPRLVSFRDDPFNLLGTWLQERAQETPVRPRDGELYVEGAGIHYVLLPLTLTRPALAMATQEAAMPILDRAKQAAQAVNPSVQVISAGVILHAAAASGQASKEMSTIGLGSVAGIVLLTWLVFGSLRPIVLVLASITVGIAAALSICMTLFGQVHLLTLVFGASLIGVAQDYGIYFLCNRMAAAADEDSHALLRRLMPGLALTLLAAVIGYMGLALTPFPGLRHMAIFSAVGLVFAWLTVVCWFPLLVKPGQLREGALARRYGAALAHWPRLPAGRKGWTLLLAFAALVAVGLARLESNDDIRLLQNPPKALVDDQMKLSQLLQAPTPVQYFLVRGESEQAVLENEEALKVRLDDAVARGWIGGYHAISNWVPSARMQKEHRTLVDETLLAPNGTLEQLAARIDEDKDWAAATRSVMRSSSEALTLSAFLQSPASEPWRHQWLGQVDGQWASIVAMHGIQYKAQPHLRDAGRGVPGVEWVDKVGEISSVLGRYRVVMMLVLAGAYVLVLLLLSQRYGRSAWRVLAPTAIGSLTLLAAMGFAGAPLQLFHVLAMMLLLGVGVDYGIFMQERGAGGHAPWLAVGLSAINAILSFGLLGLSRTPALQAFGLTMLLGVALVWLLAPCFVELKKEGSHAPAN